MIVCFMETLITFYLCVKDAYLEFVWFGIQILFSTVFVVNATQTDAVSLLHQTAVHLTLQLSHSIRPVLSISQRNSRAGQCVNIADE